MGKKIIIAVCLLLFVFAVSGCTKKGSDTDGAGLPVPGDTSVDGGTDTDSGSTMDGPSDTGSDTQEDPNADDPVFEQTGTQKEDVIITPILNVPKIVVDLGDLVTLEVYSEYLQEVHLWNEDLHVDATVGRGETVTLTIEANEEDFFSIVDTNQNNMEVMTFVVAGTSFG